MTKIFFLKADINPHRKIIIPGKNQISKFFENEIGKKPSLIENLPRSTFNNSYLVKIGSKKYVFKADPLDTRRYKILDYVEGKSLYDFSGKIDITKYIKKLGSTIAKVHKTKTKGCGPGGVYKKWPGYFFLNLEKHLAYLRTAKVITPNTNHTIAKIFTKYKNKIKCSSPRLLHGDLANHNAIYTKRKIKLIDWEDSIFGDPLYEIAYYATGVYKNDKWVKAFLAGYQKVIKKPIKLNLLFWLYFLRISIVKAVIRHRWGSASAGLPDYINRISFAIDKIEAKDYTF